MAGGQLVASHRVCAQSGRQHRSEATANCTCRPYSTSCTSQLISSYTAPSSQQRATVVAARSATLQGPMKHHQSLESQHCCWPATGASPTTQIYMLTEFPFTRLYTQLAITTVHNRGIASSLLRPGPCCACTAAWHQRSSGTRPCRRCCGSCTQ